MLARRYSGRIKVVCRFRDREQNYACELYKGGESLGFSYVGLPGAWATLPEYQNGVDSEEAFDETARAALSFAMDDMYTEEPLIDSGDLEWGEDGIVVRREPWSAPNPQRQGTFNFGRVRS